MTSNFVADDYAAIAKAMKQDSIGEAKEPTCATCKGTGFINLPTGIGFWAFSTEPCPACFGRPEKLSP
jgi:DnaJ-class molecular chaperone